MNSIADIRKNYAQQTLSEEEVKKNPVEQFSLWWNEAVTSGIDEVNAMTLATASSDGFPSARIVLLKGFSNEGFVFFTNYDSFKGQQLSENPKACLVFFWKELERQVRLTGLVTKISRIQSDEYFHSRPKESQVGAIISPQSQVIANRQWLDDAYAKAHDNAAEYKLETPENWGGYILNPVILEFWQGRPGRLHDRIQYTLVENGGWQIERLAP